MDFSPQADHDHTGGSFGDPGKRRAGVNPQTNGTVERFNGLIDVLRSDRFRSGQDLEQTLLGYVRLSNGQLPQSVLKGHAPIDALKD